MLKDNITKEEIKKIFPNKQYKIQYLDILYKSKKQATTKIPKKGIDATIISTWEYDISKQIIRKLFRKTDKFLNSKKSAKRLNTLMSKWKSKNLGNFDWPFQAMNFDEHVHKLNTSNYTETEKDRIVAKEAIKFRRLKDINAKRNDYLEYLIFESCDDIIPTLAHKRGVDFYIHGYPYDQKVSRSVSKKFIEQYGENYREIAIKNPAWVAECLYKYQDEERFGDEPRLFVVYLDTNLSLNDIEKSLNKVKFNEPYEIEFEYPQPDKTFKTYKTTCYVILLYSEEKTN